MNGIFRTTEGRSGPGPDTRSGPLTSWTWTYYLGPGPPASGPGPGHLGSVRVRTWVRQVQDRPLDSLPIDGIGVDGGVVVVPVIVVGC